MRKWLLISTAIVSVSIAPTPADAAPLIGAVSALATWFGGLSILAQAAIRIGAGVLISALLQSRQQVPDQPSLKRELPLPTSTPAKRTVFGHCKMTGTPLVWRVDGGGLYGCILFNSEPSAGTNLKITVDGRESAFALRTSGTEIDPQPGGENKLFDFSSDGELVKIKESFPDWDANEAQFVAWLGLGDQTSPPDTILAEMSSHFAATDGFTGWTVLWVRMSAGGSESKRPRRWPNVPPQITLEMDWTRTWDPDDEAQDPDDPDTWDFGENQTRNLLHAVRFNPIRRYDGENLLTETFTGALALADEDVVKWYASQDAGETVTEKRYRVAGVIDWSKGELKDLLQPMVDAGGGVLSISEGRMAYIPGEYQASVYTMTDVLRDQQIDFDRYGSRREVPYALKATWTAEERQYETAELAPWLVPNGSPNTDDVESVAYPMVPSGTQAQRLIKREAIRRGLQKKLSCTLPPSAAKLVAGSTVTGNCPAPFTRLNGEWRVEEAHPAAWLMDRDSGKVAIHVPVVMSEYSQDIEAWDPETDEREILTADLVSSANTLGTVENLVAYTVEVDSGGAVVLMIEYSFDAETDFVVNEYIVEWKLSEDDDYTNRQLLLPENVNASGKMTGSFGPVTFGVSYDLRAVADGPTSFGLYSYALGIIAGLEVSGASATAGTNAGTLTVDFTAPDSGYFEGVRLYRAAVGQPFSSAVQVGADVEVAAGAAHSIEFGDPNPGNLYADGGFDASGSHTMTGGWSVTGGVAAHSNPGAAGTITQAIAELTAGDTYRFSVTVGGTDTGVVGNFRLVGTTDVDGDNLDSTGMHRQDLVAPAGVTDAGLWAADNKALSVDLLVIHGVDSDDIPLGAADFWIVPYAATGTNGTPTALGTKTIT